MKNKLFIILNLTLITTGISAFADAKVDGFFPETLVKGGYFDDKKEAESHTQRRDSFFISREERRANPQKAPSNNIKIEPNVIQIRTNSYDLRNPWNPLY